MMADITKRLIKSGLGPIGEEAAFAIADLRLENMRMREALDRIQDAMLDHVEDHRTPGRATLIKWRKDALKALDVVEPEKEL